MPTPPPWGWRPKKVADSSAYTDTRPPKPSERLTYWMDRFRDGSWTPQYAHLDRESWPQKLGIWNWEWTHILRPAAEAVRNRREQDDPARVALREQIGVLWKQQLDLTKKERVIDEQFAEDRQALVTAILVHGGYHCADPDCILECVQDVGERP